MIPLSEAQAFVDSLARPLEAVDVDLSKALGAVLAADVVATESIPAVDNSAVDGFAVRAEDGNENLTVVGVQFAGRRVPLTVGRHQAVRIMTGAPIPAGADAVVMVENTTVSAGPGGAELLAFDGAASPGQYIRRVGEDVEPGQIVLTSGTVVSPAVVGLLASLNRSAVSVVRPPRVGVFSTGDELVSDGGPLADGQLRDSNRPGLLAAVRAMGLEAVDLGCVPDDETAVEAALRNGAANCDIVVTSGGVSMGDADLVKVVLGRIAEMRWMQIAIKPAKPLAAGLLDGTPILGLPGNPVSALVSFDLFARRVIERRAGIGIDTAMWCSARFPEGVQRRPDGKVHFPRVVVDSTPDGLIARPVRVQGSHQLSATAQANALARVEDGHGIAPGGSGLVRLLTA
jgi:molybdenum cofactor synthesis domain-containing protein